MDQTLAEIVSGLISDDLEAAQHARQRLRDMIASGQFCGEHAAALVRAAANLGPGKEKWSDPSSPVLFAARDIARGDPSPEIIEAIREVFEALRPRAKAASLQVLTNIPTVESARSYTELMCKHAGQIECIGAITFSGRSDGPHLGPPPATAEMAACIFPVLLDATHESNLRFPIYLMLLEFLEEKLIRPAALASHEREFVQQLGELLEEVRKHQKENVPGNFNWKYDGPYAEVRDLAALLLDLSGWWGTDATLSAAGAFADVHDPRLRLFRAFALIRSGRPVEQSELDWLAQSPRERFVMHKRMVEMGRANALPASCRDQSKLAEGHMVDWLCFGTELGREPDEIELVHVETRQTRRRLLRRGMSTEYFFFRYRVTEDHWSKANGWMVGMAGGYERTEGGTTLHDGSTFSRFSKWDEKSLGEHVADYLE